MTAKRKHRLACVRSTAFWSGFCLGLTGPGLMFVDSGRKTVSAPSMQRAWRTVGGYLNKGAEAERASVETRAGRNRA
jgi:hypothetical protein